MILFLSYRFILKKRSLTILTILIRFYNWSKHYKCSNCYVNLKLNRIYWLILIPTTIIDKKIKINLKRTF